jgi:hypothetical protein
VVDLGQDRIDGQIAACCLQGLINRRSTQKLYVLNTWCYDNRSAGPTQVHISSALIDELYSDLPKQVLSPRDDPDWPGFLGLWHRYHQSVRGLVIWDPALEQGTIEAATTIAAQIDAIPVSPMLGRHLQSQGAEVLVDLRENAFTDNVACVHWLLDNWFAGACHDMAFTWSHMTTGPRSWGAANKDYVTALRLFSFHLDIFSPDQREHYADVLDRYPPGTPVLGWADELVADGLFARLGYFMVPCISVENLTVHSSLSSPEEHLIAGGDDEITLDPNGLYAAFHIADGDNLLHSMVYQVDAVLRDEDFGTVPATWILNPGLIDLAPRLFDWYHKRFAQADQPQEFAAMMGDGHPSAEMARGFGAYCRLTADYLARASIRSLKVMNESEAVSWNVQPNVLLGGYNGLDHRAADPLGYHMDNTTFHIDTVAAHENLDAVESLLKEASTDRPLLLSLFAGTAKTPQICRNLRHRSEQLKSLAQRHGRKLHLVTASRLGQVFGSLQGTV